MLSLLFISVLASAKWVLPDVHIGVAKASVRKFTAPSSLRECRARISSLVCLVDPVPPGSDAESAVWERPCLEGGGAYVASFEGHFDRAQPLVQEAYCSLHRIFVEKETIGTAFASILKGENEETLAVGMGIRRDMLDRKVTLDQWLSWKEEISFGGPVTIGKPGLDLFRYESSAPTHAAFLDFVLDHEIGHLYDFANDLNAEDGDCRWDRETQREVGTCWPRAGTWAAMDWGVNGSPLPGHGYPMQSSVCSYFCGGNFIPLASAAELFRQLFTSSFVSPYASRYPQEDFAENFAFWMTGRQGVEWRVHARGEVFEVTGHYRSEKLREKREFLKRFIENGPRTPGRAHGS